MEKYIRPFINVCVNVFREFLDQKIEVGRPFFEEKEKVNEWDISAVIGLSGEARGAVVISMKKELAQKITEILTGKKHAEIDEDVVDALGELVNIIAGNVKKELERDFRLVISLPTFVEGKKHKICWHNLQKRVMCISFQIFGDESFSLSVALE